MSSLTIYCWLWIMFIVKLECTVIRLDHSKRMKDGLEYVMQKYLNPLRKLTAELPNHAIEMQIEIHDSIPNGPPVTQKPQRRLIRVINARRPKPAKRNNDITAAGSDETTVAALVPSVPVPAPPPAPPPLPAPLPPPAPQAPLAPLPVPPTTGAPPAPADPQKMPVYMDDLKKALDDLEKRIVNQGTPSSSIPVVSTIMARKQGSCNGGNNNPPIPETPGSNSPPFRNIDDIVQLLKKAIHVERRVPKPLDENLEWVQIKIPKDA